MDDKDRRKGYYEDVTTTFVKHAFHTRFFLSRLTKKSRIAKKIIDKILFEDDEVYVLQIRKQSIRPSLQTLKSIKALRNQSQNLCQAKSLKK